VYRNADGSFQASFADFPRLSIELLQLIGLGRRLYSRYYPSYGPEASRVERQADWVPGACLLVRMAAVAEVGLLDEDFYFYSEEVDWCFRLRRSGWEIWYCPAVEVKHYLGQSGRHSSETALWNLYRGKLRFFAKHYGRVKTTILKWGLVFYLGVRSLTALLHTPLSWHDPLAWRGYLRLAGRLVSEPGVIITQGKSPVC
jgi:GT2 family glycosyltransferase